MQQYFSSDFHAKIFPWLARISLFVVYFWFGMLKLLGLSPAEPLVQDLFKSTIGFMTFDSFYVLFSLFEVIIGVLFLVPRATKLVFVLFVVHMITTAGPLLFLPQATWDSFLVVPTLTGQYIIKNLVLIACAVGIMATQKQK